MAGGVITLPNLKYTVPGAEIDLNGTYGVDGGTLNFKGTAQMQATVSQMVGGWKGMLLKPADASSRKMERGPRFQFMSMALNRTRCLGLISKG